jgi:hypothetical protein
MAITKTIEVDKIEIIGEHKALQVRTATIIKEDGTELNRSFSRKVLHPGILDASDNLVDTDVSAEDADVKAVATAVWTDSVKTAWKNKLIADKSGPGA